MNNFLQEIENEYSRARGKPSFLAPLDWALAQSWQDKGIPLWLVQRAMGDVAKTFTAKKPGQTINSLRYFEQEVKKQFDEWSKTQVGKHTGEVDMNFAVVETENTTEILSGFVRGFSKNNLPEPAASAVAAIRTDLLVLIEDAREKQLDDNAIEDRLKVMLNDLTISLVASISEDDRIAMIEKINNDCASITLTDDSRALLLHHRLYERFGLPKLTLFDL